MKRYLLWFAALPCWALPVELPSPTRSHRELSISITDTLDSGDTAWMLMSVRWSSS